MREQNPWPTPAWLGEPSPDAAVEPEVERFSLPAQEVPREMWFPEKPAARPRPAKRKAPVSLAIAMPAVVFFALLSAFFSWVVSEPLWLAVGHSSTGMATVSRCVGSGISQRCIGELDGTRVTLLGVTAKQATTGSKIEVRRVGEHSDRAFAGGLFLRWFAGLIMILACGAGIAIVTGVHRMHRRDRLAALSTSLAAPLLVLVGFLAAVF
ncbi:hypothetical protein Rhe02_71700 [Rhizocola hellebori]|uniref:Uncharacterized protein n=1 Tax=Rhizocola hellebori TaxID=1392758 RepID=A0A8J3VKJ2_9ACTN|nr:hypothetical protein [Rhizocola hellebori]GIH09103.1 hypothetical protein Rhe02_71700 [Rhizocola hellebori]